MIQAGVKDYVSCPTFSARAPLSKLAQNILPFLWSCSIFFLTTLRHFLFWLHYTACRILVPQSGVKPVPPAVEAQSSNCWTRQGNPLRHFFQATSLLVYVRPPHWGRQLQELWVCDYILTCPELRSNAWHRADTKELWRARPTHATGSSPTAPSCRHVQSLPSMRTVMARRQYVVWTNPATRPLKPVMELNKSASPSCEQLRWSPGRSRCQLGTGEAVPIPQRSEWVERW